MSTRASVALWMSADVGHSVSGVGWDGCPVVDGRLVGVDGCCGSVGGGRDMTVGLVGSELGAQLLLCAVLFIIVLCLVTDETGKKDQ